MIDVVLLLIIFFMLTAQFAQSQQTPLNLPDEPGAKAEQVQPNQLTIDLTSEGRFKIEGNLMSMEQLLQVLAADLRQGRKGSEGRQRLDVLVRADRACPAVHLNQLATELSAMGIRDWKLATASGAGKAEPGRGSPGGGP